MYSKTLSNTLLCLSGVTSEDSTGDGVILEKNRRTDLFQLQKVKYLLSYLAELEFVFSSTCYMDVMCTFKKGQPL